MNDPSNHVYTAVTKTFVTMVIKQKLWLPWHIFVRYYYSMTQPAGYVPC